MRTEEEFKLMMHLEDRMVATKLTIEEVAEKTGVELKTLKNIRAGSLSATDMALALTKCVPVLGALFC